MRQLWEETPEDAPSTHPEDFSWLHPCSPTIPEGASPKLSGWLGKQHQSRRWGRRYFDVDDYRGRLLVSKRNRKPRTVCALQDIAVCEASTPADAQTELPPHTFVIQCGGLHLTVDASTSDELSRWLDNLQARIAVWKEKARREGPDVAKPSFGASGEDEYWLRRAADGTWRRQSW